MTVPLEREFAQVRDELNRCAFGTESTTGLHDALAALSAIERHVQDMEKALRNVAWKDTTGLCWCPGDVERDETGKPHGWQCVQARDVLAALPAREKGTHGTR